MNNNQSVDVLVIGNGVAGSLAAARLALKGYRVLMVHKSTGATGYSSGAVDVADGLVDEIPSQYDPFEDTETWFRSAQTIRKKFIHHPYARLEENLYPLEEAISLLINLAKNVSLKKRDDNYNFFLATQAGTLKKSALVQESLALDWSTLKPNVCIGVMQISGLMGFDAKPVAKMLRWISQFRKKGPINVIPVLMDFSPKEGKWLSMIDAAFELDDEARQIIFIQKVKQALNQLPIKPDYLLFPAMMGFQNPYQLLQHIKDEVSVDTYELLAISPSVPGMRLSKALQSGVEQSGVKCVQGKPDHFVLENHKIKSIFITESTGGRSKWHPKVVILATGRVLAGGIVMDGTARETFFNLPIWVDNRLVKEKFSLSLTQKSVDGGHDIFRAGLLCDKEQRPFNQFGEMFASNLFAAGSIINGYDPVQQKTGLGVAAVSGFKASEFALKAL